MCTDRVTKYRTIVADPPWRFSNRSGKGAPEHRRLRRYATLSVAEIAALPIASIAEPDAHLYLWVPNALLADGHRVMSAWGFVYKTSLVWFKRRSDGGPDLRCMGFYFRNVTEFLLFGVRGHLRTLPPARKLPNVIEAGKHGHSVKPEAAIDLIETVSPGPYVELFARRHRLGWDVWGDESANTATLGRQQGGRP